MKLINTALGSKLPSLILRKTLLIAAASGRVFLCIKLLMLVFTLGATIVNFSTDANAAINTVNDFSDSLENTTGCTLRKAIIHANSNAVTYNSCDAELVHVG